jgi:hypothetical protein
MKNSEYALALLIASATIFGGCNAATNQGQPVESGSPAVQTPAVQAPAGPPVSINAEMVSLVDHAGHALWDVERSGNQPATPEDWERVAEHATQIAAAGSLIALPGTGPNDITMTQNANWKKWSRALSDAGVAALEATQSKNMEALVAANGRLVDVCENCHKEFKPSLPSEGIMHKHMHVDTP